VLICRYLGRVSAGSLKKTKSASGSSLDAEVPETDDSSTEVHPDVHAHINRVLPNKSHPLHQLKKKHTLHKKAVEVADEHAKQEEEKNKIMAPQASCDIGKILGLA
jgi:hypothetical protein